MKPDNATSHSKRKWAKTVELVCFGCGTTFTRLSREHNKRLAKGNHEWYCSNDCQKKEPTNRCVHCGTLTRNPKYCSSSCAAKVNGSLYPKRINHRTPRFCRFCESTFFLSKTHKSKNICESCYLAWKSGHVNRDTKIGALLNSKSVKGKHPSWKAANVRMLNRKWNCTLLEKPCARCGYDLHVELAHIKAISSFPISATLGEVNDPDNVIQLCPNCHWEFDNGIFSLEDLPRIELGLQV